MKCKQEYIFFFFIIFFNLNFASAQSQTKEENLHNTYAIVVGISGYQDAAIPQLRYADKDASLFSQWLQTKAAGSVPAYNIKLLINQNATVAAFYNALDWAKQKAKENDLVYIYFSGHGDVETKANTSEGYLLAWNSPPNNYLNNAISVSDLNNTAETISTKNKAKLILITDACHSGKMAGDYYKGRQLTANNLQLVLNNQVRMASCKVDEEAAEGIGWGGGRGVFSYYLLKGLQGAAEKNDLVKLDGLQHYLDSSFGADIQLKQTKHIQHPVSNGTLSFTLAKIDPAKILLGASLQKETSPPVFSSAPGLQSLRSVGAQPVDYFFALADQNDFANSLPFDGYLEYPADTIPIKIVEEYCAFLKKGVDVQNLAYIQDSLLSDSILKKQMADDVQFTTPNDNARAFKENHANNITQAIIIKAQQHDTLNHLLILLDQLKNNKYSRDRFAERFLQVVHDQSQDMINAYLKGDGAELEKRQYYATGKRDYKNFLPLMQIAILLAPENNYLKNILQVDKTYLHGLIDRLAIATNAPAADSLIKTATKKMQRAMQLEPYSAYIHNEMGNILFQRKIYDSALYHFNFASILAPSWAIPYSNKIRVGLATDHLAAALTAAKTADSLQPNFAFVNINAGLVAEKSGDLLAAESYYLRAIRENNVHYLPYERLGYLYLQTTEYEKADKYFYEAHIRKDLFAVNPAVFDNGIGMSRGPEERDLYPYHFSCTDNDDRFLTGFSKFNNLITAVTKLSDTASRVVEEGMTMLEKVLKNNPDEILVNHYLAKQFFNDGSYFKAEKLLKKAIGSYRDRASLKEYLKKILTSALDQNNSIKSITNTTTRTHKINLIKQNIDSSCLLNGLLQLNYNELEDHYLLANIYQQTNRVKEEISEYKIISEIENKDQGEQAAMAGFYISIANDKLNRQKFFKYLFINGLNKSSYQNKYFEVSTLAGTVKLARLLVEEKNYKEAEKVLVAQVTKNETAGYVRQKKLSEYNLPWITDDDINSYWQDLNEKLENETAHFYNSMIALFPQDEYWYKNAGLFLYRRLLISFNQIRLDERKDFYLKTYYLQYPFRLITKEYKGFTDYRDQNFDTIGDKTDLPGTGETLKFFPAQIDPVFYAKYYLHQALKFSGDAMPNPELTEYIADLQSWMGGNDSAIINYKYALTFSSRNVQLLTKLSDVLRMEDRKPEMVGNYEILKRENKLSTDQRFELTDFYMLQHRYKEADTLLQSLPGNNAGLLLQKHLLKIKFFMLQNEFKNALPILTDLLKNTNFTQEVDDNLSFTKTRIDALHKNYSAALETLDHEFGKVYGWYYVLSKDDLLIDLRKQPEWKTYLLDHPFVDIYGKEDVKKARVNSPFPE